MLATCSNNSKCSLETDKDWAVFCTFPACTVKFKSLKIGTLGLVGYVKLTCCSSTSPLTIFKVFPACTSGSILDSRSNKANTELTATLTLVKSGERPADWETPSALIVIAKKTCKFLQFITSSVHPWTYLLSSWFPFLPGKPYGYKFN